MSQAPHSVPKCPTRLRPRCFHGLGAVPRKRFFWSKRGASRSVHDPKSAHAVGHAFWDARAARRTRSHPHGQTPRPQRSGLDRWLVVRVVGVTGEITTAPLRYRYTCIVYVSQDEWKGRNPDRGKKLVDDAKNPHLQGRRFAGINGPGDHRSRPCGLTTALPGSGGEQGSIGDDR
jgi:hypothetical protein